MEAEQQKLASLEAEVKALRAQASNDAATIQALRTSLEEMAGPSSSENTGSDGFCQQVVATMPTEFGDFQLVVFAEPGQANGDIAMVYGSTEQLRQAASAGPVLARIHSACFTGEVVGSHRCDCGEQLTRSMKMIAQNGSGVVVYLQQEGRGIGLINKLKAYNKQDEGLDTIDANLALGLPADAREYGQAGSMLRHLGVSAVRLITNNPDKVDKLQATGIRVDDRISIVPEHITSPNYKYLQTKASRMGHMLGARFDRPAAGDTGDATLQKELPWAGT